MRRIYRKIIRGTAILEKRYSSSDILPVLEDDAKQVMDVFEMAAAPIPVKAIG